MLGRTNMPGCRVATFLADRDVCLTPTLASPPPPLGRCTTADRHSLEPYLDEVLAFMPFTALANMTGLPATSVPLAQSGQALPVGVHFSAAFGDDALLFRLAAQLEHARPWTMPAMAGA